MKKTDQKQLILPLFPEEVNEKNNQDFSCEIIDFNKHKEAIHRKKVIASILKYSERLNW